jgi:curved DNA-binding protein CbpA
MAPPRTIPDDLTVQPTVVAASADASRSELGDAALHGTFGDRPFPELLGEIRRRRATGALALRRHPVEKTVFFRDGVPRSIQSNLVDECLGRVMVQERMISEAECEESLRRMKGSGRKQGAELIEMGCISQHNLVHALRLQLQAKLWEVFRWEEGAYEWTRAEPPPDGVQLDVAAGAIIYEGIKRAFNPTRLARVAGDLSALYVHPAEDPSSTVEESGLSAEELRLLKAIDGTRTVAELGAFARLPPEEVTSLIWAMRCARWVELKDRSGVPTPSTEAVTPPKASAGPPPLPRRLPPRLPPRIPQTPARHPPTPPPLPRAAAAASGALLPELPDEHARLSAEQRAELGRLAAHLESIRRQDYFQILGVSRNASPADVKQAYAARAEEYHPDKQFGSAPEEVRQLASQIHEAISRAHATLADSRAREAYTRELASAQRRTTHGDVGKLVAAEGRFRKGEELMRRAQYQEARRYFEEAIQLYPDEGEFHAWLAWAIFQTAPNSEQAMDAALEELDQAIRLNPRLDKGYLFSGYIYKQAGRPDKASKQFERALECNPECTEALHELRILGS